MEQILTTKGNSMKVKTTKAQDLEIGQTYVIRSAFGPTHEVTVTEELETINYTDGVFVRIKGINATHGYETEKEIRWDTECEDC